MRPRLNLSLRRALMAAMATACTLASSAYAGVVDERYDLQYYLDFARNKGMFTAGATNIGVFFKDGTSITNNVIPLMPNFDSYGQTVAEVISLPGVADRIASNGGTNLVSSQFVYGAKHVHAKIGNTDVAFLSENASTDCIYQSANLDKFGHDSSLQRLTKLVTSVAYTPMADDAFMSTIVANDTWIYRLGNGGVWSAGKSLNTYDNTLGGVINLSVIRKDDYSGWHMEGWARYNDTTSDILTPLDIGTYFGDSGSPSFAWDNANNRFVFIGAMWASGVQTSFPNWYLPSYNPSQAADVMNKYTVSAAFSGTDTIVWDTQDATTGQGTLTQGSATVTYTGQGSENGIAGSLGLTFSTEGENEQTLQLQGSVNMGAGALTFVNGKWKLTEAGSGYTLTSAGFDIQKGAEVTWELSGSSSQEIRKVGEGILTISGSGNNESTLVVGGGTTVYEVTRDSNGNITGCTLGNAGETRLNRTGGYAASSVRLEGGVAIIVLMGEDQFKTNSAAGDTFTFGNDGGLLNLNGYSLTWGVINQEGSGKGARIGNFTPQGLSTPQDATFTYTGTGTFDGCFMDEAGSGKGTAQLAVNYNNAGGTWYLTGNHSNAGGFNVQAGTMVLQGTNTPHVMMTDSADWTYASIQGADVAVQSGGTFQLSHHALMQGNVVVETGGTFIINQTVNAASESISGSLRQDMEGIKSLIGDVTLKGTSAGVAQMVANVSSPVTTVIDGNIYIDDPNWDTYKTVSFVKRGNGILSVTGSMNIFSASIEEGGLVIGDASVNNGGNDDKWYNWTIGEKGFLAAVGADIQYHLTYGYITADSKGVLALTANQTTQLTDKAIENGLYIGAYGESAIDYGVLGTTETLTAYNKEWHLGGGTGTLNVHFLLSGENNLIIGNDYSSGTVHLTNTGNSFTGDIYIKGTGNMLTYEAGALGSAKVALSYGNILGLHDASQLTILNNNVQGILALKQDMGLDLSGMADKQLSIAAQGDVTLTQTITVADDTYRFGGYGNLTLANDLSGATKMLLDGQGNTGSSVTFANENAYSGAITAGGGLNLADPNSTGSIDIRVAHEQALAKVASLELQKGATLHTDGQNLVVNNLSAQSGAAIQNKGDTATLLQLNVEQGKSASIANGVLSDANNNASLALVKTGSGVLTMGANTSWSGGLTIMEGQVNASIANGGIGAEKASVYVKDGATLSLTADQYTYTNYAQTIFKQVLSGDGEVSISNGHDMLFLTQNTSFEGQVRVTGNTRLYITKSAAISSQNSFSTYQAFDKATIVVEDGSQARVTPSIYSLSGTVVESWADYVIAGSDYKGASSAFVQSQHDGALVIDGQAIVWGNVTLAEDAMIASWSESPSESQNYQTVAGSFAYQCLTDGMFGKRYGIINKLGGIIRGQILGEGKTLTFGGNEGMTITADSANTFGHLVIASGNGSNDDKFALRLDGGAARSQVNTALGKGTVQLEDGLILRLAGTGAENNSDVVYTYENAMNVGNGATLQSYNITNRLTGVVSMDDGENVSLNLATARGGVLELAGGIAGSGTLNVAAASKIILGSATSGYALARNASAQFSGTVNAAAGADITLASIDVVSADTTFSGTESLTLRFAGTQDYTLGGITMSGDSSALTLHFDFTNTPVVDNVDTWNTLTVSNGITASNTIIALDLNLFGDIETGSYTLITSAGNATNYTLADSLNGRLSLSTTDAGALVLNVDIDNKLYWSSADHTTQNWAEANWLKGKVGDLTAFAANSNVMLDASGVAEGNSATARETITVEGTQTVGSIGVQEAAYELTGAGSLSGTSLTVGNGGDLKLGNTGGNTFTYGVLVSGENSSLESAVNMAAAVTVEDGGAYTQSGGKLTGNLFVTDASAGIRNASLAGNINTYGSGTLSLEAATLSDEARDITFEYGKLAANTANTTLGGTFSWAEKQPTVQVQNMAISGGNVTSTVDMEVNGLNIASKNVLFLTEDVSTSLDAVTGVGSVVMQSSGKLQLGDAALRSLSVLGGTTNVTGAVTISGTEAPDHSLKAEAAHLTIGKATLNIEEGGSITAVTFTAGNEANGNSSVVNINGGTLTITGTNTNDATGNSFLLAHWKQLSSVLTLNSGKIIAENAVMHMGWDSGGTFKALGGEATLKGVLFGVNGNATDSAFVLGSAMEGTATIKIGSSGMTGIDNNDTVTFGEGTIAATANFAISNKSGSSKAIDFVGTTGTIFDSAGHTITVNTALNGTGNIIKNGAGTLALYGSTSTFSGNIDVRAGALAVNATGISALENAAAVSIGSGATLDLSAIDFTGAANSIDVGFGHAISFATDSTVAFGNMEADKEYGIFNITSGTLTGWSDFDAYNFTIAGTRLSDMGRVTVNLGMAGTFSYSIGDSWDLVWDGPATGGTWDTTDTEWQTTRPNEETISTAFTNNDNAIFNKTASLNVSNGTRANNVTIKNNSTVTLDGSALTANLVTIESGSKLKGAYASVLDPVKAFNIAAGATLEVNYTGSPNFTSEVTGDGAVLLSGGGSMTWNPTDSTLAMGTLTIQGNNTRFTTGSAFTANIVNMTQGTATFNSTADINQLNLAGGTAKFTQASLGKQGQTITMTGGTLELNLGEENATQSVLSSIEVNNTAATSTSIIKNAAGENNMTRTLSAVQIAANNTLELQQTGWNTIWNINSLSGEGNLLWTSSTNHTISSRLILDGDNDFSGTIKLDRTNVNTTWHSGDHQAYVVLANDNAAKNATLELRGATSKMYAALAINTANAQIQGLNSSAGTDGSTYAHLYAGDAVVSVSSTGTIASSTANNTLTIAGGEEYTFAGTVGTANETAHLNLAMIGSGSQTFSGVAYVGDVSVSAGKLALSNATIYGSIAVSGGELKLGATSAASLGGEGGVSLTGGTLDLSAVTFSASGGVALGGAMSVSGGLIELGSSMTEMNTTYAIFDLKADGASVENWESLKSNISVGGVNLMRYEGATLSLTDDAATLSFSSFNKTNFTDLQWAGGASGTWDATTANWDRTSDGVDTLYAFANGDSVTFNSDAAVTLSQAITADTVTIANGATVSLDESAGKLTATSISVAEGAKLSFDTKTTAASTTIGSNITGAGTVVLNLCNSQTAHWNNKITMGNGFTGEVHLNAGRMTLDGSSTGSKLVLLTNDADIQLTTSQSEVSWSGNLELRGTHEMHSNSSTKFTFTGNVSGTGTYAKQSTGKLTFGATGSVNLGGFTQEGDGETIFAGVTTLNGLNATKGSVSFGGATSTLSGTLNAATLNLTAGAMKVNFTSVNTNKITDNAEGTFTVDTLNYTGGTLEMSGTVNITTLKVGDGLTATVYNKGGNAGQNKTFGTVELGNGATLKTYDSAQPTVATKLGTVKLTGASATIQDQWNSGYTAIENLIGGSDATLNLVKYAQSTAVGVFSLGGTNTNDAGSAFAGTIALKQTQYTGDRDVALILNHASVAQNAVVDLNSIHTNSNAKLGLGVNVASATIGGLKSGSGVGDKAIVFSGSQASNKGWSDKSESTDRNTLTISTAKGETNEYYGQVQNVNLVIDGEGTQKFLGASSSFNGTLAVQGGTAAFNGSGSSLLEGASAFTLSNGGVLDLSAITFGTDAANAITLASGATYTFSGGVIDLGELQADKTYQIFDTTTNSGRLVGWNQDTLELGNFRINGNLLADIDGYVSISLGENGSFSYSLTDPEAIILHWGGGAQGTWNTTGNSWDATPDDTSDALVAFEPDSLVVFNSSAELSVSGDIVAQKVTITDGATLKLKMTDTDSFAAAKVHVENGKLALVNKNWNGIESIVLDQAGVLQMEAGSSINQSENPVEIMMHGGKIVLLNGNGGVLNTNLTVDGSGTIVGSYNGLTGAIKGSITGTGTLTLQRYEDTYKNPFTVDATISDKNAESPLALHVTTGIVKLTGTNTYTGGTTIDADGKLTITKAQALGASSANNVLGKVSGAGTLVLDLGSENTAYATGKDAAAVMGGFTGTVDVTSGWLVVGSNTSSPNTNGSGGEADFGAFKVIVRNGAMFSTHFGKGKTENDEHIDFASAIDLMSGGILRNIDGSTEYTGTIRFNVKDDNTFASDGTVKIQQHWQKKMTFSGLLEGDGTVELYSPTKEADAYYIINHANNTFAGTFKTQDGENNDKKSQSIVLSLVDWTAAQYATIDLASETAVSKLQLDSDATIAALKGADADNLVTTSGAYTLTVSSGDFAGKLQNGSDTNTLALTKQGEGKLTLSGANTYTGKTTVIGGTLELQGAGKLGAGDVSISAGAALTAATTAVKDDAGNVTAASETWATITAGEKQTAATVSGASITQTEAEKKLSIASRTEGTKGSMVHSVVEMLAGTSLTVENMVISGASSLRGQAQMTYAARSAASAETTINNSTFLLSTDNSELAGENKAMTLSNMQAVGTATTDTTGALTLSGNSNVLAVTSSLLSNLVLTSGTNFVVDFSSLLADVNLAAVDFVELSFADVSFADISRTQISGVLNPTTNLTAYYDSSVANVGAHSIYFDVRAIPEPTTTTLSILALAALVARRRRK